jgi:hypothetical protein
MRAIRLMSALAVACAIVGAGRIAHADWYWVGRSYTPYYERQHAYLSADAVGVGILGQTGRNAFLDPGGGVRLAFGGRIVPWFALEGVWQPTLHNLIVDSFGYPIGRIELHALTVDAKFYPSWQTRAQPWFALGVGGHFLGDGWNTIADGPGWHGDVGLDVWLSRWATFDLHAGYRGMDLIGNGPRNDTYVSLLEGGVGLAARF